MLTTARRLTVPSLDGYTTAGQSLRAFIPLAKLLLPGSRAGHDNERTDTPLRKQVLIETHSPKDNYGTRIKTSFEYFDVDLEPCETLSSGRASVDVFTFLSQIFFFSSCRIFKFC